MEGLILSQKLGEKQKKGLRGLTTNQQENLKFQ